LAVPVEEGLNMTKPVMALFLFARRLDIGRQLYPPLDQPRPIAGTLDAETEAVSS